MIPVHVHRFGGMESKLYLYSITILRTVLYKEILLRVDNVYYDTFFGLPNFCFIISLVKSFRFVSHAAFWHDHLAITTKVRKSEHFIQQEGKVP